MTLDTNKCTIKKMQLLPISSTFFHFDERSVQKVYKKCTKSVQKFACFKRDAFYICRCFL